MESGLIPGIKVGKWDGESKKGKSIIVKMLQSKTNAIPKEEGVSKENFIPRL